MNINELKDLISTESIICDTTIEREIIDFLGEDEVEFTNVTFEECNFVDELGYDILFSNCMFKRCKFTGEVHESLIRFKKCKFTECLFIDIDLNIQEEQGSFTYNDFERCNLKNVSLCMNLMFMNNTMIESSLQDVHFFTNMIMDCIFKNIYIQESDFKCNIKNNNMENVNMKNVQFLQKMQGNLSKDCYLNEEKYAFDDQEGVFRG